MSARQTQLRAFAKAEGLKGYGSLGVADLEKFLTDNGKAIPAAPTKEEAKAIMANVKKKAPKAVTPKKAAKSAAKTPRKSAPREDSIRTYLSTQLDKHGEVNIKKALEHAAASNRSKVTVYRQARELGLSAVRKDGVFKKVRASAS